MTDGTIKLICFSGAGRSGSTLLARLLGEVSGFRTIGEGIGYVLDARVRENSDLCSCGEPVEACEFWRDLIGGDQGDVNRSGGNLIRMRGLPLLFLPWKSKRVRRRVSELGNQARDFLRVVRDHVGADVIVDSTKNPAFVQILSRVPEVELNVIHLVRDSRGFVCSRSKPKGNLKRINPFKAAVVWLLRNLAAGLSRGKAKRSWLIRYEDFVRDPASYLRRIVLDVTGDSRALDFIDRPYADVGRQHMLAGNPDKFLVSRLTIEERAWRLDRRLSLVVTALTLPLLLWYGYLRRPARA